MRIAFIGDIVGKAGRLMLKQHLINLKREHSIDFVIANYENASHGYGLTSKNCEEILSYGVDMMTGGNHSFDKKEILTMFDKYPIIRPLNYPSQTAGEGIYITTIKDKRVAVINLLGYFFISEIVDNPFNTVLKRVQELRDDGIAHIIIDIHAETTAEKRTLLFMLKDKVSAILGTHTHIGTDDLEIIDGCCYVTDVGLTGCRDNILGMDSKIPIQKVTTAIGGYFDVPDICQRVLQMIIFDIDNDGRVEKSKKVRVYDDAPTVVNYGLNFSSL